MNYLDILQNKILIKGAVHFLNDLETYSLTKVPTNAEYFCQMHVAACFCFREDLRNICKKIFITETVTCGAVLILYFTSLTTSLFYFLILFTTHCCTRYFRIDDAENALICLCLYLYF